MYKIVYSKRKTVCLKVLSEGNVEVRAPRGTSKEFIESFVTRHQGWIDKRKAQILSKNDAMKEIDTNALRISAKEYIPQRAKFFAEIMGVNYTKITITSAKTRFGSCSAKNSLCFSLYLMTYPKLAIDYVIVHELAHIKVKNHSADFYKVVESVLPDYKSRRKLLKNGIL